MLLVLLHIYCLFFNRFYIINDLRSDNFWPTIFLNTLSFSALFRSHQIGHFFSLPSYRICLSRSHLCNHIC